MRFFLLLFISFSCYGQIAVPTSQPRFLGGRATHSSLNTVRPNQLNPQRMLPYNIGNTQQNQTQAQPQQKQPLRSHNNRYPVNQSNIMGFGSYNRLNLRDHKAQALAAQKYREKLSVMRINLRAYRIQPVQPTTPTTPQPQPQPQPNPQPQPQPNPQPQPPNTNNPNNNGGQVGIGGGSGPVPPSFPTGPVAVGMPAPQPR
jgi:hypothetical protein